MTSEIKKQIEKLRISIIIGDFHQKALNVNDWGGADVIITQVRDNNLKKWHEDQSTVISLQSSEPRKRLVVTQYSKELSWLFYELRDIFSNEIDYISKYDFYGLLAQAAIDYLSVNKDEDLIKMLITVLDAAERYK